jgi:hypothetical protein
MEEFKFLNWHSYLVLGVVLLGVFKAELYSYFHSHILIHEIKFHIGQKIEISYVDGRWDTVTIVKFVASIPFRRIGGIFLRHEDGKTEKLSFSTYHYSRKRWVAEAKS